MAPGTVTEERAAEVAALLSCVRRWAATRSDVRGVALVGSWARDQPHMGSDVDLVVLTDEPDGYVVSEGWIAGAVGAGDAPVVRTKRWGPNLQERRVRLPSGLEVEFGFADPTWAAVDPVDEGTASVVADGCRPVVDPDGLVARLLAG